MDKQEISALISLLDDPDERIFEEVRSKLLSMGQEIIPTLENAWENSFDAVIQNRIENIIHKIQFEKILGELKNWASPMRWRRASGPTMP